MSETPVRAYLALLCGLVALGFSAIFIRWANAPGVVTSFYRMLIATLIFAVPFYRRTRKRGRPSTLGVGYALLGGLFFGADMSFWSEGVMISGATNPTLLANTAPVWVGIGARVLFGERLSRRFWAGLTLALFGAIVILGQDAIRNFEFGLGSLFGLIAGAFYGAFFLAAQRGRAHLDPIRYFWFSVLGSTVVLAFVIAIRGLSVTDYPWQSFAIFIFQGVFIQSLGWFFVNYAQGFLPATLVSPTLLGQPVLTGILAVVLLQERLSPWHIAGGLAVLTGIYVVHLSRVQRVNRLAPG